MDVIRFYQFQFFRLADKIDKFFILLGILSNIVYGATQPYFTLILIELMHSFHPSDKTGKVVSDLNKASQRFGYVGIIAGVFFILQLICWSVTGERLVARLRCLYLKKVLSQDVYFLETETTPGEVISLMSGDIDLLKDTVREKVGTLIQLLATFVGGFVLAFIKGWRLSLVLLSCIPVLLIISVIMSLIMMKMSSRAQKVYAKAGNVVKQTVRAIRTVASFTGERDALRKYNSNNLIAYEAEIKQGLVSGLGLGALMFTILSTYALAVWYGGRLIIERSCKGEQVLYVIMAMMTGGMSLGQAFQCLNAFAAGQAAAYKIFGAIRKIPKIDASISDGIVLDDMRGDIELKDVYFEYQVKVLVENEWL